MMTARSLIRRLTARVSLPEATSVTDSGYRNASGECVESSSGGSERTSPGTVTIGVQLSLDPATCESEYLVATYPVSDVPAKTIVTFFDTRESLDALQQAEVTRAAGTFLQSLTNQYRDPLFIVVSQTFAGLQWTTTGTCITSTNPQHSTYAYAGTGWYRTGYNTSSPWGCTPQASANTVASFANTAFPCPGGGTTYTNHTKTMVVGYLSGRRQYLVANSIQERRVQQPAPHQLRPLQLSHAAPLGIRETPSRRRMNRTTAAFSRPWRFL